MATFIREQYSAFMDNVELIPLGVVTPEIMEYINRIHEARKIIACIGSYPIELGDVPFIKISDMLQESGQSELNWILHQERERNIRNTRLSSFVYSDAIFTDIDIVNKEDAILFMSEQLSAEGYVKESYIQAALDREREVSTDYRNGTALPHAGSEHVNRSVIGIMRLKEPIFWNGDIKVQLVFLIALEKADIKLVTILSHLIKDEESMQQLLEGSEDDILEAFNRFDENRS